MTQGRSDSFATILVIRGFDLLLSLTALVALLPLLLLIAIVLNFSGEGKVFYRQSRIGKGGHEFNLLKFATMRQNSPAIGSGELTLPNDTRILPLGRFLRKTKLNELPQLWNIVVGEMSLIGPRPQTRQYYDCFEETDRLLINTVRPGLSGVGSIIFRDEEAILSKVDNPVVFDLEVITPYKGRLEGWFAANMSFMLYFEMIFITIFVVLRPSTELRKFILRRVPPPPPGLAQLIQF